jgi:hypothetical protein
MDHQMKPASPRRARFASMIAVVAVGASMTLTACGSSSKSAGGTGNSTTATESPQQAIETAVSGLGRQSSVGIALSLPITEAQALQLGAKGGSHMTPAEAKAITTGSVFFTESTGQREAVDSAQARTDPADSYDFGVSLSGQIPLEIRYVNQDLYVRVQAQQLLTDVGQNPSEAAKLQSELTQANSYVPGLSALGDGGWVEVTHASIESLAPILKQAEAKGGAPASSSAVSSALSAIRQEVGAALRSNSTVAALGNQDGRSGYSLTLAVRAFLNAVGPDLQASLAKIPTLGTELSGALTKISAKVPSGQTAVVDLYVADNKLSEADINLNQFAGSQKVGFAVPLKVAFSSPSAPSAPAGATALDLSKLPSLLNGLLGSSSAGSGVSSAG